MLLLQISTLLKVSYMNCFFSCVKRLWFTEADKSDELFAVENIIPIDQENNFKKQTQMC